MIDCGSQVVICDLPVRLDTYEGCEHDCLYCFARRKKGIDSIKVLRSVATLKDFIKGKRTINTKWCDWDIPLHWGGMSDPFQPCESEFRESYRCLEVFAESGYPFIVSTKGSLIAKGEYLELLEKCNAVVQISMACSKYDKFEKGAPPFEDRLKVLEAVSPSCKRALVRIQPYFTDVLQDVLNNLPRFKAAGAHGVIIEGMKFIKPKAGLLKCGGDYVYEKAVLQRHFEKIRAGAHANGLAFYVAENRLRSMGDSMTCCGCEGVEGFTPNRFNLERIYNMVDFAPTSTMCKRGTAKCFNSVWQRAGVSQALKEHSFAEVMISRELYDSYSPAILGGGAKHTKEQRLTFTRWLKSTGITAEEIDALTNSSMSSHYLCTKLDGQPAIPTPEMFELLLKSPKLKNMPEEIKALVYHEGPNKKWSQIAGFISRKGGLNGSTEEA